MVRNSRLVASTLRSEVEVVHLLHLLALALRGPSIAKFPHRLPFVGAIRWTPTDQRLSAGYCSFMAVVPRWTGGSDMATEILLPGGFSAWRKSE